MMKLLRKLMIDCDTSAHYCDKIQYNEATFKERLHYKMHVLVCKICKSHSALNTKLTAACNRANLITMPAKDKEVLKAKIDKEIGQ